MTDYFELLELPRSPWLDSAELKDRFARLSGPVHPDRVHEADEAARARANQRYAELNAARQCLADPGKRLRHLIQLEAGQSPGDVGAVPKDISELFFAVGGALRQAADMVRRKEEAGGPLLRAQRMKEAVGQIDALRRLIAELEERRRAVDDRCRTLGRRWSAGGRDLSALVDLLRDYRYLNRWLEQLREGVFRLTF